MKHIVILGAGTGGTMMANHLVKKLDKKKWQITIVDKHKTHYYQPGFLFIPFDFYKEKDVVKPKVKFIPKKVKYLQQGIELIRPEVSKVLLDDGTILDYDILIVATGAKIVPEEIEGLSGDGWHKDAFDF